jgi:hypothetical protein
MRLQIMTIAIAQAAANIVWQNSVELTARFVLAAILSLVDVHFLRQASEAGCFSPLVI